MHDLQMNGVQTEHLMNMADGLARGGQLQMARKMYQAALTQAQGDLRRKLVLRMGILSARSDRARTLRAVLAELEGAATEVFVGDGLATWMKTLPFFEDPRFTELAEKHARLLPIANWHWNLQTVLWAVRHARRLEGEFVELGVFKGHTTLFCAEYVEFQDWPKSWFLYDTFEGVPEDQLDPGWKESNRQAYEGKFSFEEVRERFAHIPNIRVIKGRVPEILAETSPEKIAFIHMDLNNSAAEIAALDALFERIVPGGVIVFDDYGWKVARAQYDAENAWFAERGLSILPLPTGQGLFIKP